MRYDDDLCHFLVRIPEFWVLVFGVFGLFPFISLSSFMDESYHDKRITFQSCVFPGRGAQLGLWSWALGAGGRSVGTGSMDWLVGLGWCLMTGTGHDEGKGLLAWVDWVFSDDRGPFGGGAGWLWFGLCYGPGWQVKSWQGLPVGSVTIAAACFGQTFMYAHVHGDVVNDGDRWEHQDMDGHVGERETERGDTSQ
jgi:hypothetical protein